MRKIFLFLALMPLSACATIFNGTKQDVKISFYDAQTGEKISNDKVKISTGEKTLRLNSNQTYEIARKSHEDLHFLVNGYFSKSDKIQARISGLYYLNLLWEIPLIFGTAMIGSQLETSHAGKETGSYLGAFTGVAIGTGISIGVDLGAGGAYVYPDEVKVYLEPRNNK